MYCYVMYNILRCIVYLFGKNRRFIINSIECCIYHVVATMHKHNTSFLSFFGQTIFFLKETINQQLK